MDKIICDPYGRIAYVNGVYVFDHECPLFKSRYYARKRRDSLYDDAWRNGLEQPHIRIVSVCGAFGLLDCSDGKWLM